MYPNLKLQLWRTGVRQNRLAQLLEIDETMLSKIINGFRQPSDELRKKIASTLGSNEEWLFEMVDRAFPGASAKHRDQPAPRSIRAREP